MFDSKTQQLYCDDCQTLIGLPPPNPDREYKNAIRVHSEGLREYFHIKNDVWGTVAKSHECLCIRCLEERLGRELESEDFTDTPCNDVHRFIVSGLMRDRVLRGNPDRTFTLNHDLILIDTWRCYQYWRLGDALVMVHGMLPNFKI